MKKARAGRGPLGMDLLVCFQPGVYLGLGKTLDVLGGVRRSFAAIDIQEVQALGSLVQRFLKTGGITQIALGKLVHQGGGFRVVYLFADDLVHG